MKPFKRNVDESENVIEEKIKPFKVETTEALDATFQEDEKIETQPKQGALASLLSFFTSLWGVISAFLLFVILALIANALQSASMIVTQGESWDYIYLAGVVLLLLVLLFYTISNIIQFRRIQSVASLQKAFKLQRHNPSKAIISLAHTLLKRYEKDSDLQKSVVEIREEIERSHIYPQIYTTLDTKLLAPIDAKAKQAIHNASLQAALSTAISPLPLLDMALIFWRSMRLTREIASLYGYRPNTIATLMLLRRGVFNIAFAGVTQLAIELSHESTSATLLSKISQSAGEGIANGILLARLGYGIMEACRPLPSQEKREHFVKSMISSIFDAMRVGKERA